METWLVQYGFAMMQEAPHKRPVPLQHETHKRQATLVPLAKSHEGLLNCCGSHGQLDPECSGGKAVDPVIFLTSEEEVVAIGGGPGYLSNLAQNPEVQ